MRVVNSRASVGLQRVMTPCPRSVIVAASVVCLVGTGLPRCRAQTEEAEPRGLDLPASTLAEALWAVRKQYGLQFVAYAAADSKKTVLVVGDDRAELVEGVLRRFGARGVELDGLWFVDGRTELPDLSEILARAFPPGVEVDVASAAQGVPERQHALTRALRQLWAAEHAAATPAPPPGAADVVPVEYGVEEGPDRSLRTLWQAYRCQRALAEAACPPPPPLQDGQVWVQGGVLCVDLPQTGGAPDIREPLPPADLDPHTAAILTSPLGHARAGWEPAPEGDGSTNAVLATEVSLEWSGPLGPFLQELTAVAPLRGSAPTPLADARLDVALDRVPLWVVALGLTAAAGHAWIPLDDAEAVRFGADESLPQQALEALTPQERLMALHTRHAGPRLPVGAMVWLAIPEARRAELLAGQRLNATALGQSFCTWAERYLLSRWPRVTGPERWWLDVVLQRPTLRGAFLRYGDGAVWFSGELHAGGFEQLRLLAAGGTDALAPEAAASGRAESIAMHRTWPRCFGPDRTHWPDPRRPRGGGNGQAPPSLYAAGTGPRAPRLIGH